GTLGAIGGWRCRQYDGIVARGGLRAFWARLRVSSMMFVMLVAGIGLVLAGLLAIGFGIPMEFSTGNTLIIAGAIGVCSGAIVLALWMTVRELKNIARRLGGVPEARGEATVRPPVLPVAATRDSPAGGGFPAAEQSGGSGP